MHEEYSSSLTINEGSSEGNMDVNLALWLQVHLHTQKQTHNYTFAYSKIAKQTPYRQILGLLKRKSEKELRKSCSCFSYYN